MRTSVTAALAGAIGIVIGAAGWAVLGPEKTKTVDAKPQTTVTASPSAPSSGRHYGSAQQIADALQSHGFTVSMLHKSSEDTYISEAGGAAYDFTVTDKPGKPAVGDAGINIFPNHEALASWTELSKGMDGIAVTGDTWAVSLPTTSTPARTDSKRLAPKVATVLGGAVQQ
jgi:hypothetical protein